MQVSVKKSILAALQAITTCRSSGEEDSFDHNSSSGSSTYEKGGRFKIVPSQRQRRKLIDINAGHAYTVKKVYKDTIQWRCSMRSSKSTYCKATVLQTGNKFGKGRYEHIHPSHMKAAKFVQTQKSTRKRKPSHTSGLGSENVSDETGQIPLEHDVMAIVNSMGLTREDENTMAGVPEINMRPGHWESEIGVTQTAAENMEDDSDSGDPNQSRGVQEDCNVANCSSQRAQPGISDKTDPIELEVGLTEVAVEHGLESSESNMVPYHVGSEVDSTEIDEEHVQESPEKDMEEFQEQRLQEPEYTIVDCSSQRWQPKLIDSAGYTYTRKKANSSTTYWRCAIRNKNTLCRASVMQRGETFRRGAFDHLHPGKPNGEVAAKIVAQIKTRALQEPIEPTDQIVSKALHDNLGYYRPSLGLPKPRNLARAATRLRHNMQSRRSDALQDGSIPVDFLQKVIKRMQESPEKDMEEFQEQRLQEPEYTIVDCSSQRWQPKLIDSAGYTYTRKKANSSTTYWRCAIRNKNTLCRASVMQRGETFRRGAFDHLHSGKPNGEVAAKIVAQIKTRALQEPIEPTDQIVSKALFDNLGHYQPSLGLPKPSNLARAATRLRHNMQSCQSDALQDGSIPADFLQKVIKRGDNSHILLASPQQLQLLAQVTLWNIDLNTKVMKAPFKQLVSIHAFVADNKETKQVPMVFVLMSSKKKKDYKAVFKALNDCLPTECPVEECILDYEAALWRAISDVFPGIQCSGSAFHWSQAIWKKIQDFGIHQSYMHRHTEAHELLRKLMALPFLPAELIPNTVIKLQEKANTGTLYQLLNYIEATWIKGPTCMWSPSVWSVYMQPFRIKTDFDVWHQGLNRVKKGELPLSVLIMHLFIESKTVTVQDKLASKRNIRQFHNIDSKNYQVVKFWEQFWRGDMKLKQLLSVCATMFGPEGSKY